MEQNTANGTTATETTPRANRKVRVGVVTSNKMQKTITISAIDRKVKHPKYGGLCTRRPNMAHDEKK